MPIPKNETQAEFEKRIFMHYCGEHVTLEGPNGRVSHWETLVYAMLLDHAPHLISEDERAKRGRKSVWTEDRLARLLDSIDRTRADPEAPEARQTLAGAAQYLCSRPEFWTGLGVTPVDWQTVRNRYLEAKRLNPPGKDES